MNRSARRLREARVTLGQLALVSGISAAVSALVVISSLGETGSERAVIAALRTRQVMHATRPARAVSASSAPTAAPSIPAAAVSPAPAAQSPTGGGAGSGLGDAGTGAAAPASATSGSAGASSNSSSGAGKRARNPAAMVQHVFVIMLSTTSYAAAFGKGSGARYLNSKLRPKGALLTNYHTLGATPTPDYIAMISGQPPNHDTTAGCPTYSEFNAGTTPDKNGLVRGSGCVYPDTALTIGDQLDSAGLSWRAYMEGMSTRCEHPDSGATESGPASGGSVAAGGGDGASGYSPISNPFVFFHSLLDLGGCQSDDLPFTELAGALRSTRTPSYAFISPDPCDSGAALNCPGGQLSGIAAADDFLRRTVPSILGSPAYHKGGALLIVFTGLPPAGPHGDAPRRTGALVLSPFTKPGTTDTKSYDPYSVLRSVEDIFGLPALGRAKPARRFDREAFARNAA